MSLILKMVRAFPRGRSTEELLVLVGAGFSHDKRLAAIAELDQLLQDGLVEKGCDGRWRAKRELLVNSGKNAARADLPRSVASEDIIHAAAATFNLEQLANQQFYTEDLGDEHLDPQALLRYWRSALLADPRGAKTQVFDTHGIEWSLISGRGPVSPGEDECLRITIDLATIVRHSKRPSFDEKGTRTRSRSAGR